MKGGMERRKIKQLSDENDKLSRAQEIASSITSSGSDILMSLNNQHETMKNVK